MKRLGIILPGKIGDIIICLPIAKHYYDLGYEIFWPLYQEIIDNFKEYIDYVNFLPVSYSLNSISESYNLLNNLSCEILDLSFNSPGSWENNNTKHFSTQNQKSFDEIRYSFAKVDFNKKWSLTINRNLNKEKDLYTKLIKNSKYALIQKQSSDRNIHQVIDTSKYDGQVLELTPITNSIFDWITIIEKAERILLIESCFSNLVDQLKLQNNKQFLILKHGYYLTPLIDGRLKGLPVLKNNWIKI
jgi:hypothetical protein